MRQELLASLALLAGVAGLACAQSVPSPAAQNPAPPPSAVSLGQPLPLDVPEPSPTQGKTLWTAASNPGTTPGWPTAPATPGPTFRGYADPPPPPPPLPPPGAGGPPLLDGLVPGRGGPCFWASAEYLLWWVKNEPLPTPLLTTGNPAGINPGALNDPETRTLLGGGSQGFGAFSGFRAVIGGWLDACQTFGLEGTFFFLGQNSAGSSVTSNTAGVPPLYIPYVNPLVAPPAQAAFPLNLPGAQTTVSESTSSRLWGLELRGLYNIYRNGSVHAEALAGFRYLNLHEGLDFTPTITVPNFAGFSATGSLNDSFSTSNQFYGAEIGARAGVRYGRFTADVFGTLSLGGTHEVVSIAGSKTSSTTIPGFGSFGGSLPGGFFAEPSNIGQQSKNVFAVAPEVGLQLGYQFTQHLRGFVGYNFLYISNVVRPGNQLDSTVNLTQFGGTPPVGPARPAPLFNQSDFWAQGLTFGLEFRW